MMVVTVRIQILSILYSFHRDRHSAIWNFQARTCIGKWYRIFEVSLVKEPVTWTRSRLVAVLY